MDNVCPWCGVEFVQKNPSVREYEAAMSGHAEECDVYLAEQG